MVAPLSQTPSSFSTPASGFVDWLKTILELPDAGLYTKLRGNILHILCETQVPLEQPVTLLKLVRGLLDEQGSGLLKQTYPQVYQLYIYSRQGGSATPTWTAPLYLNRLERHLAQLVLQNQDEADLKATQSLMASYAADRPQLAKGDGGSSAVVLSNLSLARKGDPEAIAWYLSETLSALDVGVWVSIKAIPGTAHLHRLAIALDDAVPGEPMAAVPVAVAADGGETTISRLWILCEATYSPDPSLIARPTAERLRQLQLTQFKDAVLLLQVRGEQTPDWSLRIDLTPPEEMLREWGRWGDANAIARALTATLSAWKLQVETDLANGTLHIICRTAEPETGRPDAAPITSLDDRESILKVLSDFLETLAPQGIYRAVVYGQLAGAEEPSWVSYLDLPASHHDALAETPEYLAQTGDLPAIAFLLTRQLNPNLDDRLATGGLRVQLLVRDQLLHVMVDSPVTPRRRQVVLTIRNYLLNLSPVGIQGIRIYGRRSGQAKPTWSYGKDFVARHRLVPEATPEFTASDAYVNELLVRPDSPVTQTQIPDEAEEDVYTSWLAEVASEVRQWVLKTHLVSLLHPDETLPPMADSQRGDGLKIAMVWGAVGLLAALQLDWMLGQLLSPATTPALAEEVTSVNQESTPEPTPDNSFEEALSQLNWPAANASSSDDVLPNGEFVESADFSTQDGFITSSDGLAQSPLQPAAALDDLVAQSPFPTFNSQQLDEKLALYQQRVAQDGPPDVLIVGSSRALRGIDPQALRQSLTAMGYQDISIFNFGINGATAQVVDLIIRQVIDPEHLPRLILWADGARAFNSGREDVTFNAITVSPGYRDLLAQRATEADAPDDTATAPENLADPVVDPARSLPNSYATMDEWMSQQLAARSAVYEEREQLKSWLQDRLVLASAPLPLGETPTEEKLDAPMPAGSVIDFDGFLALSVRFNPATYYQDYARVAGRYDGDYYDFQLEGEQSAALAALLEFTQSHEIPMVFVNTPLTDEYLDDYRRDAETQFLKSMLRHSTTTSGFIFRDLGQVWPDRYDYFSDPSHLNRYGAYQVSNQLAQDPMIAWPRSTDSPSP
jgi:hypothetical protein